MSKKYNLTNKKSGKLTILRLCTEQERPTKNHGNYWLCQCECGNMCKVPTAYLTGKGKYVQTSCGCERKKKAFEKTSYIKVDEDFLEKYNKEDFEKFLMIHKAINKTTSKDLSYFNQNIDEYKKIIDFFWNDNQFNCIYDFWKNHKNLNQTFYDWAKPSLDHIIPISRGGKDDLSNYQFLTTFENLAKRDMTMEEWNNFKLKTNTKSDYFIENIVK